MAVTKPKRPKPKSKRPKVAHYGGCPPGQIRDHNKGSKTYGKCIPIVAKKKRKKKPKSDGFMYG